MRLSPTGEHHVEIFTKLHVRASSVNPPGCHCGRWMEPAAPRPHGAVGAVCPHGRAWGAVAGSMVLPQERQGGRPLEQCPGHKETFTKGPVQAAKCRDTPLLSLTTIWCLSGMTVTMKKTKQNKKDLSSSPSGKPSVGTSEYSRTSHAESTRGCPSPQEALRNFRISAGDISAPLEAARREGGELR